jgi:hypothetical protein
MNPVPKAVMPDRKRQAHPHQHPQAAAQAATLSPAEAAAQAAAQGAATGGFIPHEAFMAPPQQEYAAYAQHAFTPPSNPLVAYYRAPGISVELPSRGLYMPPGTIGLDMAGEIQVLPMTAADEILLKSPDALMSGYAVEQMLRSCVPGIQNPRLISMPDLDVLLLAVRAASYGNKMDVDVTCPKCDTAGSFTLDIRSILATAKPLPDEKAIRLSADVIAYLQPFTLEQSTRAALTTFHEAKAMQGVENLPMEERTRRINESFRKLTILSSSLTAACVMKVATPQGVVVDRNHIADFMKNIPGEWTRKVDAGVKELNEMGIDRTIHGSCQSCGHEFSTELQFDPASFFD